MTAFPRDVVVLLSGGIDSTVLAAFALKEHRLNCTVAFNYHQPAVFDELPRAKDWADRNGVRHHVVELWAPGMENAMQLGAGAPGPRVVPGRNLTMLSYGVAVAQARGATRVWIGATADDRAEYPDCRWEFIEELGEVTARTYGVRVGAPFVHLSKRRVVEIAHELGVDLSETWSCYQGRGKVGKRRPCGSCDSCKARAEVLS